LAATLAGWRAGAVVLNGAKVWVSDTRPPLACVYALLDAARHVFAAARGPGAAPAPLPFGPFRGLGMHGGAAGGGAAGSGAGSSSSSSGDLAALAAGGPSWGAAVRSVGGGGFAACRQGVAFKELMLDTAELQRLDLGLLARRAATRGPAGPAAARPASNAAAAAGAAAAAAPPAALGAAAVALAVGPPPGPNAVEAFYHALLNLAVLHATVALDGPSLEELTDPAGLAAKVGYNVGGTVATIADLMQKLQAARPPPEPGSPTDYEF
jgi:hypothetical protein